MAHLEQDDGKADDPRAALQAVHVRPLLLYCYFYQMLSDGTRKDIVMYVDDGYCVDSGTAAADAELKVLHEKFTYRRQARQVLPWQ